MRALAAVCSALILGAWASFAAADEGVWRPGPASRDGQAAAQPAPADPVTRPLPPLKLGLPLPIASPATTGGVATSGIIPASYTPSVAAEAFSAGLTLHSPIPLVRAQAADPLSPPPFPGAGPPPPGAPGGAEAYNCGVVAGQRGFFGRMWDSATEWCHGVPGSVTGIFQQGPGRGIFQSDHKYDDKFISPVSDPFHFEDPRALTEVKPIFIWQRTPGSNPIFAGGDNFFGGLQARLAITDWFSVVINKVGWVWTEPQAPGDAFENHAGMSELWLGPKITFYRGECCAWAAGATFQIPVGPSKVFQDTGTLSIDPYFSFACAFGQTTYGSFNFLNTTGYSIPIDKERTDQFHSDFHLSFDVGNCHKFYPLVELDWSYYPFNGGARPFTFEGGEMFNFGSTQVAGHHDLVLAVGARYKFSECFQVGLATGFNLLNGGNHLDRFNLTADVIFRY